MRRFLVPLTFSFAAFAFGAQAEPAYNSEDIVQHFIKSAKLGEARAICIGTDEECKKKKDAPLDALDMRVNFELNSARLTPDAQATLEQFAKAINDPRLEIATFEVDGHTDGLGEAAYNDDLSMARAKSVSEALSAFGVSPDRIVARGFGESKPVSSDVYDGANRRVEARMVLPNG